MRCGAVRCGVGRGTGLGRTSTRQPFYALTGSPSRCLLAFFAGGARAGRLRGSGCGQRRAGGPPSGGRAGQLHCEAPDPAEVGAGALKTHFRTGWGGKHNLGSAPVVPRPPANRALLPVVVLPGPQAEMAPALPAPAPAPCSAPIVASQLLLVDEVLRAGMNMRRGAA